MLEALFSALVTIVSGPSILFLILGVMLGLVVGVIPGFGGTVGLSLLLPFVFGMEPISGIAMMMGLMSVVATSDTFPAAGIFEAEVEFTKSDGNIQTVNDLIKLNVRDDFD